MNVLRYPDGQASVVCDHSGIEWQDRKITMRINSYEDLFILKGASDVYRHNYDSPLSAFIPCLFGQRSDRRFSKYQSFDLKIICDFINSCNFNRVYLFDPHSDVGPALINNSVVCDTLLKRAIHNAHFDLNKPDLVSPDAGAYKKVFKLAEEFNAGLVAANKFRDEQGKISLNFSGDVAGKTFLILDDISEYGNTFKNLADKLKDNGAEKVYLYVSHFSGGGKDKYKSTIEDMLKHIDGIYTTNSVRDFDEEDKRKINVFDVVGKLTI